MHIKSAARALALALLTHEAVGFTDGQVPLTHPSAEPKAGGNARPNIIFILTDDQDLHMNSLDHTPLIKKHLIDQGTLYKRHFCTTAVCCPSRASIFTGKLAHNTNVTDLNPPYGTSAPLHFVLESLMMRVQFADQTGKADSQSSSRMATMRTTCRSGCRTLATTRSTPERCSMHTPSGTMMHHT